MRIIAGTTKSRRLQTLKGVAVRPTADRVRESIFNIIGSSIQGKRVLDLFAGFGAMGLEALSRGAGDVTFVEKSKKVRGVIQRNLDSLCFDNARIFTMDVFRFLRWTEKNDTKYDFIFADPPYVIYDRQWLGDLWPTTCACLDPEGVFCLEHPSKWTSPQRLAQMEKYESRKYGQTVISLYRIAKP